MAVLSQHTCLSRTYCELQLRGNDPDSAIVAAVITALPAGGLLFQVSGSNCGNRMNDSRLIESSAQAHVNGTMGAQLTVPGAMLTLSTGATFNIIYRHT